MQSLMRGLGVCGFGTCALVLCLALVGEHSAQAALPPSGAVYIFGKINNATEPLFLNDTTPAPFLQNVSSPFRAATAGPSSAGVITEVNGNAEKIIDPTASGELMYPVEDPPHDGFCQICKGVMHTVAVTCWGVLYTWGIRAGNSDPDAPVTNLLTPIELDLGEQKVVQIACGENHTLILTDSHNVYSFGMVSYGRLGVEVEDPKVTQVFEPVLIASLGPSQLPDNDSVCFVQAGGKSSFAITEKGAMYAWGANEFGQLGIGNITESEPFPKKIESEPSFVACEVATGKQFSVGYDDKGDVWSWGAGASTPTRFGASAETRETFSGFEKRAQMVAVGEFHAAVLLEDGNVYTYGYNRFGQLGVVLDAPFSLEEKKEGDPEPESPIWTLVPHKISFLEDKNISSIFAAGNYTIAHSNVKTPFECPCARGGRPRRTFFRKNGLSTLVAVKPVVLPKQPDFPKSELFAPVSPHVRKNKVEQSIPVLPGEVEQVSPKTMQEIRPLGMGEVDDVAVVPELAAKPAMFYHYPADSLEAQVIEEGVERGAEQKLFGRHVTAEGYYYGDSDTEVSSPKYARKRVMETAKPDVVKMPESTARSAMTTIRQGPKSQGPLVSLSLQDMQIAHNGQDTNMKEAIFDAVKDMMDTLKPVDFSEPPEGLHLDESELIRVSSEVSHAPTDNALMP